MKRDLDLIRSILLSVEKNADPQAWIDPQVSEGTPDQISYHVMLLTQAGLIEGWDRSAIGVFRWSARNLTWQGHEVLEAARDDAVWHKAKHKIAATGGGVVFEIFAQVLVEEARARVRGGAPREP